MPEAHRKQWFQPAIIGLLLIGAVVLPAILGGLLFYASANPLQRMIAIALASDLRTWATIAGIVFLGLIVSGVYLRFGSERLPSTLASLVLAAGLSASLCLWLALRIEDQHRLTEVLEAHATGLAHTVEQDFADRRKMLDRMARRWEEAGGTPKDEWTADAVRYIAQKPGFQAVEWIDADFTMRWVVPLEGNEAVLDLDLCFEERRCHALTSARDQRVATVSQSIDLVQGGKGFLLYEPIFLDQKFDGLVTGVFRIEPLISQLLARFPGDLNVVVVEPTDNGPVELFRRSVTGGIEAHLASSVSLTLANNRWDIEITPSNRFVATNSSPFPKYVLGVCLILSLFLAASFYFGMLSRIRESLLASREAEQRLVTDNVPALIASFDTEKRYRVVNQVYADHFGMPPESFPGRHVKEVLDEAAYARVGQEMDRAIQGKNVHFEMQVSNQFGELRWVAAHYVPDRDDLGRPRGFYALIQDIHEEKLAKEALRESEQRFQYAAEGSSDGLFDWFDITKDEVWWSPRFYELLGYNPDEIESGVQAYFELVHPDDIQKSQQDMEQMLKTGEVPIDTEIRLCTSGGEYRWFRSRSKMFVDAETGVRRIAGSIQDVHEERQAKEALAKTQERFDVAIAGSSDGLWDWFDTSQNQMWWSPSLYDLLGYDATEIPSTQDAFLGILHPDDRERTQAAILANINNGAPYDVEYRLRHKDGQCRWFRARGNTRMDEQSGATRMAGSLQDVSDRKRAERALAESEERLRLAMTGTMDGLWDWDIENKIAWNSPRLETMLGYPAGAFSSTPGFIFTLIHPDHRQVVRDAAIQHFREGERFDVECMIKEKSGAYHWCRSRGTAVFNENGRAIRMSGSLQSIQAIKDAEEALAESEERWRLTASGSADGMWDWNVKTDEVWYAQRFKMMLGYADKEFPNEFSSFEAHLHPGDHDRVIDALQAHINHGAGYDIEYRLRMKRGEYRWFRSRGQALFDDDGTAFRMAGSIQDINAQKVAEKMATEYLARLAEANEDLRQRNQELDEFTYIASHDLQEPLRKLSNFTDLLEQDVPPEALNEDAQFDMKAIKSAASRMRTLVHDLLELSRSGRRDMDLQDIPLDLCLDQALDALSIRIEETEAVVSRPRLPQVLGDMSLLTQVFQNLLSNAIKFSDNSSPQIEIDAVEDGQQWTISVSDHGIGIGETYREQIFAPFKRLHGREQYEGSGIGLTICRKVVERHGGKMWVEETPGGGSTFKFILQKPDSVVMENAV